MVGTSGIREKLSSKALRDLARERGIKRKVPNEPEDNKRRPLANEDEEEIEEEANRVKIDQLLDIVRKGSDSLANVLPKPKNSSAFGPTVKLDRLFAKSRQEQEQARAELAANQNGGEDDDRAQRIDNDGMLEVDISKVVSESNMNALKDLTVESSSKLEPEKSVIVPGGKEKQKNQITYLARLSKANELKLKDQAAAGRQNKAAARAKYGW